MKFVVCLALVGAALAVPTRLMNSEQLESQFHTWKAAHGKVYASEEEHQKRLAIFAANHELINKHNSEGHGWSMAINQFADLTPKEFEDMQTLFPSALGTDESPAHNRYVASPRALPASVDWRDNNLVNPVKNQGSCGSCWAFSTIVSYEGQVAKKTGTLSSFSEQNLVDCVKGISIDGQECCDGCQGGLMDSAFEYMIEKQGGKADTESSYPYTGRDGTCSWSTSSAGSVAVQNYTDIKKGDEDDLKNAVANVGPISVAVDANLFWQFYSGGVFHPIYCNKNALNHGVAVVGYGSDGSSDYWIIRNSWGSTWGEKGYMRMKIGSNLCGVANSAVYPNV